MYKVLKETQGFISAGCPLCACSNPFLYAGLAAGTLVVGAIAVELSDSNSNVPVPSFDWPQLPTLSFDAFSLNWSAMS